METVGNGFLSKKHRYNPAVSDVSDEEMAGRVEVGEKSENMFSRTALTSVVDVMSDARK